MGNFGVSGIAAACAVIASLFSTQAFGDGVNGGRAESTVSVEVVRPVTCTPKNCVLDDGEIMEPSMLSKADEIVYIY